MSLIKNTACIEVQDLADFKRRTSHFAEFAQNFVNTFAAKGMGKEINRSSLPRTKNEANGGSLLKVLWKMGHILRLNWSRKERDAQEWISTQLIKSRLSPQTVVVKEPGGQSMGAKFGRFMKAGNVIKIEGPLGLKHAGCPKY